MTDDPEDPRPASMLREVHFDTSPEHEEHHHKKLKPARSKAEVIRTIVGICQLFIALATLIVVLSRT